MKKLTKCIISAFLVISLAGCTKTEPTVSPDANVLVPGSYVITTKGMNEGLTVEVVLSETKIDSVTVKEHKETKGIADEALAVIPKRIVDEQSITIDVIAGATRTSEGIAKAVEQAITDAKGNVELFKKASNTVAIKDAALTNDPLPETWDMTYDVVVVGGGFAGLAAAHTSQNNGSSTVLVEKMPLVGGQSAINGGQYAAYTSSIAADLQTKFSLEPDTAQQHIEDTIKGGDNLPQPELVEIMVYGSPMYFNTLLENGLKVRDTLARPGGHYGYRTYVTENSIGADITNLQKELVDKAGATVMTNTKMVQLFKDAEGRVVGIKVATQDGLKTIKAEKGVILASGGFSSNVEMRLQYDEKLTADIPTTNNGSSTGEGLRMAMELGAQTTGMEYIQRYPWADPNTGVLDTPAVMPFTGPSYGVIYVDENGNRYVNEGERRDVCANAAVATGGTSTFSIFTREVATWVKDTDLEAGIASGRIYKADSLEELVKLINANPYQGKTINMDAATLSATVARHNGFIDSKTDEDFGKVMSDTMKKIENGPYYAIPQWPSVHHTMGGLSITPNAEVLDADGKIIPGLFAAGEVTGGIHGTNRLGSNADADACTFGMVAGNMASTGVNPVAPLIP